MTVDTDALVAWLREQVEAQHAELLASVDALASWVEFSRAEDPDHRERLQAALAVDAETKRARIDLLAETAAKCPPDDWPDEGGMEWAPLADYARHLLRLEAQPYADRPGFKPEWRLT